MKFFARFYIFFYDIFSKFAFHVQKLRNTGKPTEKFNFFLLFLVLIFYMFSASLQQKIIITELLKGTYSEETDTQGSCRAEWKSYF